MDILEHDERVPVAAELGVPVVLVGVPADPAGLHCVDLDFEEAARLAVDELAGTHHDEIIVVNWRAGVSERRANFAVRFLRSAHRQAEARGIPLTVVEPADGRYEPPVDRILAGHAGGRLGLVVPNGAMVVPLMHALRRHDVVPGVHISVIGVSPDREAGEYTNVSEEPRDVSRTAMDTLFRLLDPVPGPEIPAIQLLAPRLTRRGTVMR
ncbi:substrate-binding domain-containing protein [Paractinoplanes durhamensis]